MDEELLEQQIGPLFEAIELTSGCAEVGGVDQKVENLLLAVKESAFVICIDYEVTVVGVLSNTFLLYFEINAVQSTHVLSHIRGEDHADHALT